jgi:branched-chain amino acid transport system substrate-binding protein
MRKTNLRLISALAVGVALVAGACGSDDNGNSADTTATTAGGTASGVKCDGVSLGYFGPLTGDAANLGINIKNGADLAVSQFNAKNPDCKITLVDYDSQGDPKQAPALADKAIADAKVVGIVGPAFSGESRAANPKFNEAVLPIITPSATGVDLSANGWTIFHRALANDGKQGPGIAKYISGALAAKKVVVIDDASEYGKGLADIVKSSLGPLVVASDTIDPKAADYSAAVSKAKDAAPDVVFYGGYYAEAGKLAKQLQDAGVKAVFVSGDGTLDKGFVEAAGPAAEGAIITCTCAPTDSNPEFLAAYKAKFNSDPATYGPEAYDAANAFLAAIAAGKVTRADINEFLKTYDAPGVTKQLKWDATGEVAGEAVYAYKVEGGKITALGLIK